LKVANAGGIPPFIQRANGSVDFPEVGGFALGQGLGAKLGYTDLQLPLARGDLIILTSDGVVEAKNATGELWGFERLTQALARGPRASSQAMLDHLLRELKGFTGETEPHDDLTIMIAQI
jgi:serine phosphatase RsbU (regulator of sigma subunit)